MTDTRQYLGDSVYAELENSMIKLTTDNGYGSTNIIYLEPEIYEALKRYAAWCNWDKKENS